MDERMRQNEPYSELRSERDYEKWSDLAGQFKRLEGEGASKLSPSMKKLLVRVGWLNKRLAFDRDLKLPSIIGTQRSLKLRFLRRMIRSLKDLQYFHFAAANGTVTNRTWFDESDFEKVLTKEDIVEIVQMTLRLISDGKRPEYADAILDALREVYTRAGEDIVIIRGLQKLWGLPEHRRSFSSR